MKFCQKCGKEITDEAVVCPDCGCKVEQQKVIEKPATKFCQKCGKEIIFEAIVCPGCGCDVASYKTAESDGLGLAAKIFLIVGCVTQGWLLLPLAWCLPITLSIFEKMNRKEPIGTGLKVCALLFVNTIAGILLLCRSSEN